MANLARSKLGRLLLCVGLTATLLAACDDTDRDIGATADPQPTPTARDSRVIGLVGTLSGPGAWRGEDAFEGADVSVGDLNRRRGDEKGPL